jgi:D-alanyl-D-alanine carboxypeptidase
MSWAGSDEEIKRVLADLVDASADRGRLPSLVAAAGFGRRPWWTREVGLTGRQYRIGSITKTFTAALVMRLRDEGRLDLDDSVSAHLPDAPFGNRSVRSLLAHCSGMPAEPAGPWWERSSGQSWDDLVAANAGRSVVFRRNTRYHYSNLGYAVLGQLVARLRKASWWECVQAELLVPLGLAETTYLPLERTGALVGERVQETGAMAPAGQLWSTPADLISWADVLAQGRGDESGGRMPLVIGPDTLSQESAVEMRTVQSGDPDDQHEGAYGLGLRLHWAATGTLAGHTGSMPGFLAAMFVDPRTHVSAVVMANVTTGLEVERLAADMIARLQPMGYHLTERENEPDPEDAMPDLEGDWFWGNTRFRLTATSDGLILESERQPWRFVRDRVDGYLGRNGYTAGETLSVVRRADGTPSHLEVATFVLTREPYDPSAPIPGGPPIALE